MKNKFWKFMERASWFFPLFLLIAIGSALIGFIKDTTFDNFLWLFFLIYLFPPLLYRVVNYFLPLEEGRVKLGPRNEPCAWMISYRIQLIYNIVPFFERALNSLPGIYSNWLRLWGSHIGRMVYWAPDVRILDRTHLTIGDNCFVGSSTLSCHLAFQRENGEVELTFKPITIGNDVFIPAQCNIGPGSRIKDKEKLQIQTFIFGNRRREAFEV